MMDINTLNRHSAFHRYSARHRYTTRRNYSTHRYRQQSPSVAIIVIIGFMIWTMSSEVVWLGDDIDYQFRMKGAIWQSWGWIKTWSQFMDSQLTHYMNVNGRFFAHCLVQLFNGILGQQAFALCNAITYPLFCVYTAKCCGINRQDDWKSLMSVSSLCIICFVTKMMPTCQIGYIWMMTFNLIWLVSFFRPGRPSWWKVAVLGITGIAVGNGQECISIGVCGALGIWWLRHFVDWRRSWMILGYFLGTASCCLSPATLGRVSTVTVSFTDQLYVCSYSMWGILILILTLVYIGIRYGYHSIRHENTHLTGGGNSFWTIALIILIVFNVIIGIYSNRQLFGANLCAIILTFRLLKLHRFAMWINVVLWIAVALLWGAMWWGISEVRRQYDEILALHKDSNSGIVEYDRHRVTFNGIALDAKYYEDILGQFDNDLHHSIMKQLKHSGRKKTLVIKPKTFSYSDSVVEYYPSHYTVTAEIPDSLSPEVKLKICGHRKLFGILNMSDSEHILDIVTYSRKFPPRGTAVIFPEYPLFHTDSIAIIK